MESKEKTYMTKSLEETKVLAREWLGGLSGETANKRTHRGDGEWSIGGRDAKSATVVGLSGDLGSGKTSFVQGVAEALGVTEHVTSPTFILEKIYKIDPVQNSVKIAKLKFENLVHIDAYRLEGDEAKHLGLDKLMADPGNLILVEWPERIAEGLPFGIATIHFKFLDESTREINW